MSAWRLAYNQLANIFIDYESTLAREVGELPHGWTGWKQFTINNIHHESDDITSFYLSPSDGSRVPASKPGQYISIKRYIDSVGYDQPRQYSISHNSGDYYRISVKREHPANLPPGIVSNVLHSDMDVGDNIDVSAPFGEFVLNESVSTPVVLISAGVGFTPCVAMLDSIESQSDSNRQVVYVHSTRNHQSHAMKQYIADVVSRHSNIDSSIWYTAPTNNPPSHVEYDHAGRIQLSKIQSQVILPDADYYLCGPIPFMHNIQNQLSELGVDTNRIHSEVFGLDTR